MSYRGLGVGGELHCSLSSQGLFNISTQRLGFALASTPGVAQKSNDTKTSKSQRGRFRNNWREDQLAFDVDELTDAAEVVGYLEPRVATVKLQRPPSSCFADDDFVAASVHFVFFQRTRRWTTDVLAVEVVVPVMTGAPNLFCFGLILDDAVEMSAHCGKRF